MHQFSIITPSYNRSSFLIKIYEFFCTQLDIDFEWIIVDDGSTDNTKEVVASFEKTFEIKYIYKENGGKPSAMNLGTQMAESYISVSLDSDDILCSDTLKTVWDYFDKKTGKFQNNCVCISGLCQYDNGAIIGKKFPHDYYVSDHVRYRNNKNIRGDKLEFVLTSVLKTFPFPHFANEKNIAPSIIMIQIAKSFKTLYVNKIFCIKQFLPGGLSTQNYWFMYTKGSEYYYNEASTKPYKLFLQVKHSGLYIYFAKRNSNNSIYKKAKNKAIFPFGLIYYFYYFLKIFFKKLSLLQNLSDYLKHHYYIIFSKINNYKVFKTQ